MKRYTLKADVTFDALDLDDAVLKLAQYFRLMAVNERLSTNECGLPNSEGAVRVQPEVPPVELKVTFI